MPLGALRPTPLVEQAIDRLREQITAGEWPVGTRLPGETSLAQALGVGRSTVREALRALAGAGLVRARQGAGVFVIATEPEENWSVQLLRAAVVDVYEVRMMVEVEAVQLAAARRTDADLTAIEAALAGRAEASGGSDAQFVDADIALHAAVVAAAHNPVLTALFTEFVPALRQGLIDLVRLLDLRRGDPADGADGSDPAQGADGAAGHAALVAAVARGDAAAAGRALRDELERTLSQLQSVGP
ncbi:FadR/GntR family transcriptional regulator [Streptomyces sp. NPDC048111]|uniref:FadR/GntR family transcriptional regulator n=1 Tax=Streptomyces sp. NPDC048111 TaxID=3365500 RepID=UPI0037140E41